MYFVALATDYDGTLAEDGVVAKTTLDALRLFKQSGRKLILVTGRECRICAASLRTSSYSIWRWSRTGRCSSIPRRGRDSAWR